MLTDAQRTTVWEEWLSAEIRANYFGDLASTYYHRQRLINWLTLLFSSGAVAALLPKLSIAWLPAVLAALAAATSLFSLVSQYVKNAVDCSDLHSRWNKIAAEYQDIWINPEADDAPARL